MSRISTLGMHQMALAQMQARQSELARTQQQMATGQRLVNGRDDPVAAGIGIALDRAAAEHERLAANANLLSNRLSLEESALTSITDRVARLREIALQANSGIQTADTRRAFLAELREHRSAMVALGNTSDGQGRFLFGGTQDGDPPFVDAGGTVAYAGDQARRQIEIAPGITVGDADPGSEVFQRVRTGNSLVAARAVDGNAGTAVLKSAGFTAATQWDGDDYRIEFTGGNYTVRDGAGAAVAGGAFVSGQSIDVAGYQVTLQGAPADGDAFTVGPAPNRDLFAAVDDLIALIQLPDTPGASKAAQQNGFYAAIEDLGAAADRVTDLRAGVGARLATIDATAAERESQLLSLQTTLSSLRDLDYAEATTRLAIESAALEASHQSFVRIQGLSLFSLLR